ncbi:MAG: hypothetical protein FJ197_04220 [Gammaproteobacteria bacterium]|nr:hypothetical protein [Gammaproteobacteria bacterium]
MSDPLIIYVPGIKPKPPTADHHAALWRCLTAGVSRADADAGADLARHPAAFKLVSWAHVFYDTQRDISLDQAGIERLLALPGPEPRDRREARSLGRRMQRALYRLSDAFPPLFDLVSDPNMRATLRDIRRYFANERGVAVQVRKMVGDALLDAWRHERRVLLIGHSLGSVIAFDALWELSHLFAAPQKVDLFLSVGSPLGLRFVRSRLLGSGQSGERRFPTRIRRWKNIAAIGEMTTLDARFAGIWGEMRALGLVDEITDQLDLMTWFRNPDGLNVHKCYGYLSHPACGAIVARWWRDEVRRVSGR